MNWATLDKHVIRSKSQARPAKRPNFHHPRWNFPEDNPPHGASTSRPFAEAKGRDVEAGFKPVPPASDARGKRRVGAVRDPLPLPATKPPRNPKNPTSNPTNPRSKTPDIPLKSCYSGL